MAVCLNHTDREATTRCVTCFKPLCYDCVVRRGRNVYCSRECLENHQRTSGSISRFAAQELATQRRKLVRRIAFVLLVAAAVVVGCLFYLKKQALLP